MRLLEEKDKQEYKKFLESHDRCNFQQSLEWGGVKTSWKKEVILSEDKDGNIRGSLCVWIRKIPIFGNISGHPGFFRRSVSVFSRCEGVLPPMVPPLWTGSIAANAARHPEVCTELTNTLPSPLPTAIQSQSQPFWS